MLSLSCFCLVLPRLSVAQTRESWLGPLRMEPTGVLPFLLLTACPTHRTPLCFLASVTLFWGCWRECNWNRKEGTPEIVPLVEEVSEGWNSYLRIMSSGMVLGENHKAGGGRQLPWAKDIHLLSLGRSLGEVASLELLSSLSMHQTFSKTGHQKMA